MEIVSSLLKVLWAPREALLFASKRPAILAPLILIMLFSAAEAAVFFLRVDAGQLRVEAWQREGIADNLSMEDQLTLMNSARQQQPAAAIASALRPILVIVAVAGLFFACFSVVGRTANFKTFLSITAFAFVPLVIRSLASIITMAVVTPSLSTIELAGNLSPAAFMDPSFSRVGFVAAGLFDVVSLWILALLAIGYGFVAGPRVKVEHRVIIVFGVWVLYAVCRIGLASVANI
jgi:hypothetical protein